MSLACPSIFVRITVLVSVLSSVLSSALASFFPLLLFLRFSFCS